MMMKPRVLLSGMLLLLSSPFAKAGSEYYFVDSSFCVESSVDESATVKLLEITADKQRIDFNYDLLSGVSEEGKKYLIDRLSSTTAEKGTAPILQLLDKKKSNGLDKIFVVHSMHNQTLEDAAKSAAKLFYSDQSKQEFFELLVKVNQTYGVKPKEKIGVIVSLSILMSDDDSKMILGTFDIDYVRLNDKKDMGRVSLLDAVDPALEKVAGRKLMPDERCGVKI